METDFDARAKTWDEDPAKVERARAVAEAIRKAVPLRPDMQALEYGCGTGLLSFPLQPELGQITLADSSAGMLEVLRRKIAESGARNMTPVQIDLLEDPLPAQRFGLIYSLLTLHHISDTQGILGAFYSLLEAGGYLCISDLDREDGSFHGEGFSGHNGFDRAELKAKAEHAGFAQISFTTVHVMRKNAGGGQGQYPMFLMIASKR